MTPRDPPARHTVPEEFHSLPKNCSLREGLAHQQNDNIITASLLQSTHLILQQTANLCSTSLGIHSVIMRQREITRDTAEIWPHLVWKNITGADMYLIPCMKTSYILTSWQEFPETSTLGCLT